MVRARHSVKWVALVELALVAFVGLALVAFVGAGALGCDALFAGGDGGSGDGGFGCGDASCAPGLACCAGACVNQANDARNCGACGNGCPGTNVFCGGGACGSAPCDPGTVCAGATLCCGASCCAAGLLCCEVDRGGPSRGPECARPIAGTCPVGCPLCR